MKPLLKPFSLILLAAGLALSGCYEGAGSKGNKGGNQDKTGGPGQKIYGLVTIDVFRPNDQALTDATCGGIPTSMIPVRQDEMDARVKGLTEYLSTQADVIRVIPNEIDLQNCQYNSFSEVETRATQALPDPQVDDSVKAKLALHVRLVMWYGAGGSGVTTKPPKVMKPKQGQTMPGGWGPSYNVITDDWADAQRWHQLGFNRVLSVNEFAITGPQTGYMWDWQMESDSNNNFTADVVMNPPPTDDGSNQVLTAAKNSSAKFGDWLTNRTQGL